MRTQSKPIFNDVMKALQPTTQAIKSIACSCILQWAFFSWHSFMETFLIGMHSQMHCVAGSNAGIAETDENSIRIFIAVQDWRLPATL